MHPGLWREVWILVGIAAASLFFGLLTGRPFLIAAFGFGFYIVWTLRQLRNLHRWLIDRHAGDIPEASGLWGEIFDEIYKLVKQASRRQDQLSGMLARFQKAASAMPDAVVVLSQEDNIEWANSSATNLLGIHFPRDAGARLINLLREPDFAQYLQRGQFAEPLETNSPENHEAHISIQIIPFGSNQKLVIASDVTRLARLEQMRRVFIANVSHELRTPLTVLGGYVETLHQMDQIETKELKKHLAIMHEQSTRMQRLVDDLLILSRLETEPQRTHDTAVDVASMLAGLKEQAARLSGDNHHVITLDADPALQLLGNRDELFSAFSNLINNAVRYTPLGGHIALRWHADENGGARFAVTDTGEGIAPEHIPHLTERFYRVDSGRSRASGGTGLGLSIVKHILIRHDARLGIESEMGVGSTFICIFPPARTRRTDGAAHAAA
jgi:two-component system phosphate regulon sensor histidine kinase PhoR